MTLVLTSEQQEKFAATTRALLSPLDPVGLDRWQAEVLEHLARLVEADSGGFLLPVAGRPPYALWNLPDQFAQEFLGGDWAGADVATRLASQFDMRVWSTRLLGERAGMQMPDEWFRSRDYREFYSRYGIQEGIGFIAVAGRPATEHDEVDPPLIPALLTCFRETYGSDAFGERGLAILRMLLPALEAGVTTGVRLAGAIAAVRDVLDASPHGALVVDVEGRRLLVNRALEALRAGSVERARLDAEIDRVASAARGMLAPGAASAVMAGSSDACVEAALGETRYRIWATLLGEHLLGHAPAVLVQIERLTPAVPSVADMQARWSLTPQEARLARLLARGQTNREIAAALGLRPTTARHYTEAVFAKLGVHTRSQAVAKMLSA